MTYSKSLVWFRRDLRLQDHRALSEACRQSKQVYVVFVLDTNILNRLSEKQDRRVAFIHEALVDLDKGLMSHGGRLIVLHGNPIELIPQLAQELAVEAVFTNEDYEAYAKTRDHQVAKALHNLGVDWHSFKDHVVFSGSEILKSDGTPYRVFTPYKKAWLRALKADHVAEAKPNFKRLASMSPAMAKKWSLPGLPALGFKAVDSGMEATVKAAKKALADFKKQMKAYADRRDFPAEKGTSQLSVYLRFGLISIRSCVRAARETRSKGAQTWLSELIWRDFYQMILDQFPHVESEAFQEKYRNIKWPGKPAHFKAWCKGQTGYPLVDAAMRQLNQAGWMHNRLRMVVASFLVKDLLIDWRKGEEYFATKLLDFDKAANNGGWQWCASTGCDAQPYFRIFNPVSQSKKFDPEGEFIRQWVPELAWFEDKDIHFPSDTPESRRPQGFQIGKDYPAPVVDHQNQRYLALRLFDGTKYLFRKHRKTGSAI
ncbi:MAG: deoxyribodipyrimidine photo-lyase [Bdellovibrionaceae bacterium]|nr:deoxyribodipyrimidine photo-lyase [Bdellovibrionales bacterium]MCB9083763.1 deoxyribodipyrimidine photo-lyase [Pseudobdellovibrionaceae bacterium]